jgi:hypothetical protein
MAGSGCSFVLFGALAGGFVSGLAGFDTGLVALGIWLHVIEPRVAASLVVVCSVVSQAQTISPRRVFGRDARWPTALATGARRAGAHAAIGFAGGIMGGLAGLSGTLPTMWATPRAWGKDERRGVFQAFNLTILSATLIAHTVAGMLSAEFERLVLLALPGTVTRACLGSQTPQRPPIRPRRADPARRVGGDLNLDDPGIAVFRPKRSSCPTFFSPSRPAPRFAARRSSLSAFRIEARRPERPSWAQSGMGDLGRVWTALRWQVAFWSSAFRWLVRPCVRPLMRPSHAPLAIMPFARVRSRP